MKAKPLMGIYQIKNLVNGKIYIGSSVNIVKRFQQHKSQLRRCVHYNEHLQSAWNMYGESQFRFEIIEVVENKSNAIIREQWYLDKKKPEYNLSENAIAPWLGRKKSESHIKKMAKSLTGRRLSKETKQKVSIAMKGRYVSDETRKNMSNVKSKDNHHFWGKHLSDEHKKNIGKSIAGEKNGFSKLTEQQVIKIRRLWEDKTHNQMTIAKMFNVSTTTISDIVNYKVWKHLSHCNS